MKRCAHCGWELMDEAEVCTHCGSTPDSQPIDNSTKNRNDTLAIIARAFLVITLCLFVFVALATGLAAATTAIIGLWVDAAGLHLATHILLIILACSAIPLCWIVPITIVVGKRLGDKRPISIALKICTLLFVCVVSGILMLCMSNE